MASDQWQVIDKLGEGGFGQVYLVRHLELETHYALKLIHSNKSGSDELVEQFKRVSQDPQWL